eukprot:TRINITY_DN19002_c0_g1_i2.p1 TRINITY_DN19002_c0_g1~~TRINITY_DN19002_c0_g1_i2.p1  ORF type:complete len:966 (-),score=205.10 TRINITY_DN19002_c0_g1_i2:38-2935(-)
MSSAPLISQGDADAYLATGDGSLWDMLMHFFSRGHKGRVTCVDASANADFLVTGGVDYTVRIWKFQQAYDSYDLYAILAMSPKSPLIEPEKGLFASMWEMVFPKQINWDDEEHKDRGMSAVACVGSKYESPFTKDDIGATQAEGGEGEQAQPEKMRNGPIVSGNVHGDFFIHCLYSGDDGEGRVEIIEGLHSSTINDISIAPLYYDGEPHTQNCKFILISGGDDGVVNLINILCSEEANPAIEEPQPKPEGFDAVLDVVFKGGGYDFGCWKKYQNAKAEYVDLEANENMEEEEGDGEDEFVLRLETVDRENIVKCEHDKPVLCCRFFGDTQELAKPRFASCTEDEAFVWTIEGERLNKLNFHTDSARIAVADRLGVNYAVKPQRSAHASEITGLATVWKYSGSLILVAGKASEDEGGTPFIGVWSTDRKGRMMQMNDEGALIHEDQEADPTADLVPVAVYKQPGALIDVDQASNHTTFATDLRGDFDITIWNLQAVSPGTMLVNVDGAANLLVAPEQEKVDLVLTHQSKVIDTTVVEDDQGGAIVVGCDDGNVVYWDLSGIDKGQIICELRSLNPLEVFLPPLLLLVSTAQMMSFAFGPTIPWKDAVKEPAVVTHKVMMLDFKYTVKIDKELIFWPEVIAVLTLTVLFQLFAIFSVPENADLRVRRIQNSQMFKDEASRGAGCAHFMLKIMRGLSATVYLMMQLLSTVLVAPMVQSIAQGMECVRPEGTPWTDILLGNPQDNMYLQSAPHVKCWKGNHAKLMVAFTFLLPAYFVLLVPFASCGGDAHYVTSTTLWDYKVWENDNAWTKAAVRSATDLHLAYLHPRPQTVFTTNFIDLLSKIALPVVTTLLAFDPLWETSMVTFIGFVVWVNAILNPRYVERKMTVLDQDLKLFTMLTMACGVMTVYIDDQESWLPTYCLIGSGVMVTMSIVCKLMLLRAHVPVVKRPRLGVEANMESNIEEAAEE